MFYHGPSLLVLIAGYYSVEWVYHSPFICLPIGRHLSYFRFGQLLIKLLQTFGQVLHESRFLTHFGQNWIRWHKHLCFVRNCQLSSRVTITMLGFHNQCVSVPMV